MSVDATIWAWKFNKQQISSLEKLILLSLADRANEYDECYPSGKRLEKDCNTNIKTIYKCIDSLYKKGIIEKTGEMKGKTKSVPIYRLLNVPKREDKSAPKNGYAKKNEAYPKTGKLSVPKNGYKNLSLEPKIKDLKDLKEFKYFTTTKDLTSTTITSDASASPVIVEKNQEQNIIAAYHEVLPDSPEIRVVSAELSRQLKSMVKQWKKYQKDGNAFSIESFKDYLKLLKIHHPKILESYQTKHGNWRRNNLTMFTRDRTICSILNGEYNFNNNKEFQQ